jgi:hypothetical protein
LETQHETVPLPVTRNDIPSVALLCSLTAAENEEDGEEDHVLGFDGPTSVEPARRLSPTAMEEQNNGGAVALLRGRARRGHEQIVEG